MQAGPGSQHTRKRHPHLRQPLQSWRAYPAHFGLTMWSVGPLLRPGKCAAAWRTTTTRGEVFTSQRYGFLLEPHGIGFFLETKTFWILFCLEGNVLEFVLSGRCCYWFVCFFLVCLEDDSVIGWCGTFGIFVLSGRCVVMSLAVLVFFGLSRGRQGGATGP